MRPADTSPEAWRVYLELQRKATPEEKLARAIEISELIRSLAEAGMRQRYPQADDREIFLRLARIRLGKELFETVYRNASTAHGPAHRNA
jgi:hypothetical protein